MSEPTIEPHKITKPIQLLAVWFAGLVLLVGAFLGGAAAIKEPAWLPSVLAITAIVIVPVFIVVIFVLQTRFRTQFLDDPYYAEWLKRNEEEFKNFHPENVQATPFTHKTRLDGGLSFKGELTTEKVIDARATESWAEREKRRRGIYEKNRGLFLVHVWRPSHLADQVADISISLHQHREGPLSEGNVESVEYHLGPLFFNQPVVKTNREDNFRLDVSAYGPMLCLARVNFSDGTPSLDLERYINF